MLKRNSRARPQNAPLLSFLSHAKGHTHDRRRRARTRRHVEAGRLTIVHQRQMVERLKAEDRDTKAAKELLAVLERTQKVFEYDLAYLEKLG